ncbi:MAG: nucleotidyltransferase family protein [Sarcina sp.]
MDEDLLIKLKNIFSKFNSIEKVKLFGSRATGQFKETSDIDLCLFGEVNHRDFSLIYFEIDELNTPLKFDLLNFNSLTKKELIDNILKEGIDIYG